MLFCLAIHSEMYVCGLKQYVTDHIFPRKFVDSDFNYTVDDCKIYSIWLNHISGAASLVPFLSSPKMLILFHKRFVCIYLSVAGQFLFISLSSKKFYFFLLKRFQFQGKQAYVNEKGKDVDQFEVGVSVQKYGTQLIFKLYRSNMLSVNEISQHLKKKVCSFVSVRD